MEPLLRAWLARVDHLLPTQAVSPGNSADRAPAWRVAVYGGDGVGKGRAVPARSQVEIDDGLTLDEERELREALELCALALRVDQHAFMAALTRGMEWIKRQWTYEPFAEHEWLQVQVSPDLRSREGTMFRGFLRDLDDETASAEFKAARSSLLAMGGITQPVGPLLELLVQLEVYPLKGKISSLVEVMQCFSRESFYVSRIAVLLVTPKINIAEATELLRVVHSFRDTARIDIHVDIPAGFQDHTSLTRWKALFDLATRKSFADPALDGLNEYTVSVEFGDQEYRNHRMPLQAKATTATACLSALAHVGSHVTSVTTTMAMQVHKKDRHVRAKYLGYMLRIGTMKELTVKEQCLSDDDVDHILGVYCNTSHKECIRALWEEPWHGSEKAGEFEREDAERLVPDRREVIGVMQDIVEGDDVKEGDETIDVFLIGYGQCGVEHGMLPLVREVEDATKELALPDPSLKSLTLKFMNGKETLQSIIRLVGVVGRRLEELTLDLEEGAFPLMMILLVLESCRGLRKLTIKALGVAVQDDSLPPMPLGTQRHRHLVSLSIELATFENAGGLKGLCEFLGHYTPALKEFELDATPVSRAQPGNVAAIEKLLTQHMPCLEKLRVRGFNPGFLKTLWDSERPGPRNIRELYLEKLKWNKFMWGEFMAALANPRHPLARSVHTLHLMLGGSENLNSLAAMLHQNSYLSNVSITVPRAASSAPKIIASCQATNGLQLQHRLSPRHKMAFLSVITKSAIPWESHVMSMIFSFAAPTATRFVRLYLSNSSEAGERDEALERLIAHYYPGLRLG